MDVIKGQENMDSYVIEVTELISDTRCDLWGNLEATTAFEANKMSVRGNMHIDTRVNKVADFKYKVKF